MSHLYCRDKIKIIVVQRKSNVSSVPFSLSVECRLIEPLEFLQKKSTDISWIAMSEQELLDCELIEADLLWFNKHLTDEAVLIAQKAKQQGLTVFFDLDDWIIGFPSYSGAKVSANNIDNFRIFMALADEVTVANERLLHEVRPYRSNTELVTNGFYVEKYWTEAAPPIGEEKKIVFTNADFLKMVSFKSEFLRVLDSFFYDYPDWCLDYYGKFPDEMTGKNYIKYKGYCSYPMHKRCLLEEHYAFAVVPLGGIEDSDSFSFNACKNPFKYLDYAGLGIPGIYSCVPIYEGCIVPGHTGILVQNTFEAWRDALEAFASSADLRHQLRTQGFEDVRDKHHIRYSADKMESLIRKYFA